jgi:hypothetical protein
MPKKAEIHCTPSDLSWDGPLGGFGVARCPEIVSQPSRRGAEAGPRGCRGRLHRGTLGKVGAPPVRGEAGPAKVSAAPPLGGPGV